MAAVGLMQLHVNGKIKISRVHFMSDFCYQYHTAFGLSILKVLRVQSKFYQLKILLSGKRETGLG